MSIPMSWIAQLFSNAQVSLLIFGSIFVLLGLVARVATPWVNASLGQAQRLVSVGIGMALLATAVVASLSAGSANTLNLTIWPTDRNAATGSALSGKWR